MYRLIHGVVLISTSIRETMATSRTLFRSVAMGSRVVKETMRTLSAGTTNKRAQAGVTLVEMLIVVALIGLLTAVTYPSAAAGIDSLRLRAASNEVVTFLNV